MTIRKILAYVVRRYDEAPQVLALTSSDGRAYEVIRGHVEPDEPLATAVLREIEEESGLIDVRITKKLGVAHWQDEEQTFFLCEAPGDYPNTFSHRVTGNGHDEGVVFDFCWLSLSNDLHRQLIFGGDRFVAELLAHFEKQGDCV
jgi:8-oxo-dGTP pyrophosphatase MutT (NUDIX family)